MNILPSIFVSLGISIFATGASYLIDTGCSCGPARGFPFSYVHPLMGCTTGRFVVGANVDDKFSHVFDVGSVVYDLLLWGAVGYIVVRKFTKPRLHDNAP